MEITPLVSVIIPVYNGARHIRHAIESVLAQTLADVELLVVDDGSVDGTWEVIESYGARVKGLRQPNSGVAVALNHGIAHARGQYLAWLSHDDVFLPNKLERQLALLESEPTLGGCYSDYFVMNADGAVLRRVRLPHFAPERMIRHLLQWMFINGSTVLARRACFKAVGGFDPGLRYAQDSDMWFRILRRHSFGHIPEPLVQYRIHAAQGTWKFREMRRDAREFYRRCLEDYPVSDLFPELRGRENNPQVVARARNCLGDILRLCHAEMGLAREQYRLSLSTWPSPRNFALWKAVLLQWWLPSPEWFLVKTSYLLRQTTGSAFWANGESMVDSSPILYSNRVHCDILPQLVPDCRKSGPV